MGTARYLIRHVDLLLLLVVPATDRCRRPLLAGRRSLRHLSLVKCSALTSLCLGLAPAGDLPLEAAAASAARGAAAAAAATHRTSAAGAAATPASGVPAATAASATGAGAGAEAGAGAGVEWVPADTLLSGLRVLKLGLSAVQVLALALPALQQLDVSAAGALRHVQLRCPALETLSSQACRRLPPGALAALVADPAACPVLQLLDAQHAPLDEAAAAVIGGRQPPLRSFLRCAPECSLCRSPCWHFAA